MTATLSEEAGVVGSTALNSGKSRREPLPFVVERKVLADMSLGPFDASSPCRCFQALSCEIPPRLKCQSAVRNVLMVCP